MERAMIKRTLVFAALSLLGACASTLHTLSYRGDPDADVWVGEGRYQVWFHRTDQTVLVQRGAPASMVRATLQNVTIYAQDTSPGIRIWGAAANAVLQPIGCYATEATGADQMREIHYVCREPVDVAAQVAAHRAEWRQGVRVPAPEMR
jgi:hypothetical protein